MLKQLGNIFITAGTSFLIYAIILYYIAPLPMQIGFIVNAIVLILDVLWFICLGILLIWAGLASYRGKHNSIIIIQTGGHFFIFSLVFLLCTFVFNHLAKPVFNSNGRIFTFFLQSWSRLINPSLSYDFLVPFGGIVLFMVIAIWFQCDLMERIKKDVRESD